MNRFLFFSLCLAMISAVGLQSQVIYESDTILQNDPTLQNLFGFSLSIDNNHLITGAHTDHYDANGNNYVLKAGAVYHFEKNSNGKYIFKQKITPSNREHKGYFGYNQDISGNSMIVGAEDDKFNATDTIDRSGAVYLFNYSSGSWVENARFQDPDTTNKAGQEFGRHIAIHGDFAVVGDRYHPWDANGNNYLASSGAVFIYKKDASGNWAFFQKIVANDRQQGAQFGLGVDIYGDFIAAGCEHNKTDTAGNFIGNSAGAVYLFQLTNGTWTQTQKVLPNIVGSQTNFAGNVEINNNHLIVTDRYDGYDENENNYLFQAGAVEIYKRSGNQFVFQQKIVASDRALSAHFGDDIALGDGKIVVNSAISVNTVTRGRSYLFIESGGVWNEVTKIEPSQRPQNGSSFTAYNGLAIQGNEIFHCYQLGHPYNGAFVNAVYVYNTLFVSVPEFEKESTKLTVFPNPASTQLNFKLDTGKSSMIYYQIFGIDGDLKKHGTVNTSAQTSINIETLPKGVYFVTISGNERQHLSARFIKR